MPTSLLPCAHCRTLVPHFEVDNQAFQAVASALYNGSKTIAAAELKYYVQCQDAEAQAWVNHLLSCAYAWPTAEDDQIILQRIEQTFKDVHKPAHFTDYNHCEECKEHDETLRAQTRDTLQRNDLGNDGWDPFNFSSAEGIGYFFPALARFALLPAVWRDHDWYGSRLLWHLSYAGNNNRFLGWCSTSKRDAVYALLQHLMATRLQDVINHGDEDTLRTALAAWAPLSPSS